MSISSNMSIAELRSALESRRNQALDLQMSTTDQDEWDCLNIIRWELEDIDNDLYKSQFIKNSDRIEKLIGEISAATDQARGIIKTLGEARQALQKARARLDSASSLYDDLSRFYTETEEVIDILARGF